MEDGEKTNGDKLKLKKTERLSVVNRHQGGQRGAEVQAGSRSYMMT